MESKKQLNLERPTNKIIKCLCNLLVHTSDIVELNSDIF